mgnify:CR=1 FL=1|jgi:translation initiation factor 2 alpha subunit (eIF-2alpha)
MEEGDIVIGKVEKVTNTITFVNLSDGSKGTLISSEISPGRIKFLRQFVVPNKTVVCKILSISNGNINLSLRRVNSKERKEVMQKFKQESAFKVAFKQILGEDSEGIIEKILEKYENISEFVDEARSKEVILKKYIPKEKIDSIKKITEKKRKKSELKQKISIKCKEDDGVIKIKKIFEIKDENVQITYVSAGNFKLKLTVEDFKEGKKQMQKILEELEERAKKNKCEFQATEEK